MGFIVCQPSPAVEEMPVADVSQWPDRYPSPGTVAEKSLMPIYDANGKRVDPTNHGFSQHDSLKSLPAWWVVDLSGKPTCHRLQNQEQSMGYPLGHVHEASNLLEVFTWLVENFEEIGTKWFKAGQGDWATFTREVLEPEGLAVAMPVLIARNGRTIQFDDGFDIDEEKQTYEHYEIPVLGRTVWAILVPHPAGGDQLVYVWHSDYDDRTRASFKKPHFKSGGPGIVVKKTIGEQLFERLHTLMGSVSNEIRGYPHIYSCAGTIWVAGRDYPKKFEQLHEALLFMRDHKGWGKVLKKLRPSIRKVLASLESRMAIRRFSKTREAERFLCKLTGVKLKPIRDEKPKPVTLLHPAVTPV